MDESASMASSSFESLPDLTGEYYIEILRRLHDELQPQTYLEIGTRRGDSLGFVKCPSIAIDPGFQIASDIIGEKRVCAFYQMTSDRYFERYDPKLVLGGPIEIAFLDGMHRCEFLLRDFMNTERHCNQNSVVIMHDCVPVETPLTNRVAGTGHIKPHRHGWWLGDVWRTLLALKRHREDLKITVVDAPPSGLVCVTNLDPCSTKLANNYAEVVSDMLSWSIHEIGIANLYNIIGLESTSCINSSEQISRRFWL